MDVSIPKPKMRLTNYRERFKFTGKERDEESGYDYFGARYYWSLLMHWLSVDPLSDKYPGVSSGISTFLVDEYLVQVEHW